ncbi:MAG: hypothetical protein ACKVQR_18305 [Aquabacterium sp.]
MAMTYSTVEADLAGAASEIEALWVQNLIGHDAATARTKLRLGYQENPAGPGAVVLLRAAGEAQPMGTQGLYPRRFHQGGRVRAAVGMADYVVSASHRFLGPALVLLRSGVALGHARFDFVYGTPNAKAAPVLVRAGLTSLGLVSRHSKLLASRAALARQLPSWIAAVLAPLVDIGLRARDAWFDRRQAQRLVGMAAPWDSQAVDEIWNHRPTHGLFSERTSRMLRWRFVEPARHAWHLFVASDGGGRSCGYVAWRRMGGMIEVGDFFSRDPAAMTLPLMLAFGRFVRRQGGQTVSVEFFGDPAVAGQLSQAGWVLRPDAMPLFISAGTADLPAPDGWYLTSFDNDAD